MDKVDFGKVILAIKNRYCIKLQKDIAVSLGMLESNLSATIRGRQPITDGLIKKLEYVYKVNPEYLRGKSDDVWCDGFGGDVHDLTIPDRVTRFENEIKAAYGLRNQREICEFLGVKNENLLSELKSGKRRKLSDAERENMLAVGINPLYIMGGSDLLWIPKSHTSDINGDNNTNVQGDNNSVNASALLEKAIDEISAQRKLTEQANEIALAAQNLNIETQRQLTAMTEIVKTLTDKGQQA